MIFVSVRTVMVNIDAPGIRSKTTQTDRLRTMTGVRIKGVTLDSDVNYTIESQMLKQFPKRKLSELENPYIVQTSADGVRREIHADFAELNETSSVIVLKGNARVITRRSESDDVDVFNADQYTIRLNSVDE